MTRGDAKTRVRLNLADAGITFYKSVDIDDSLQDAYYWVSVFANTIEKTIDLSFQKDRAYYNLALYITDLFAVTGVYDLARHRFLTYKTRLELIAMRRNYEVWAGPPEYFFVHDQNFLYIGPQMPNIANLEQTDAANLKVFYRAFDDTVTLDIYKYRIPPQGEDCLEYYATADLLEQAQEWTKAQMYWDKFYKQMVDEKIAIRDRPMPALINALAGVTL